MTMNVYQAINAVQAALAKTGITKSHRNTQGAGFNFRGIDDVYNAVSPLMAAHGLCVLPRMLERECIERQSKNGGALYYVAVKAEFDLVSSSDGSRHTISTFGEAMDSSDKATNKAMSAAYKYALIQAFAIPTEGNNDADADTPEAQPTVALLNKEQCAKVRIALKETVVSEADLLEWLGTKAVPQTVFASLEEVPAAAFTAIMRSLAKAAKKEPATAE